MARKTEEWIGKNDDHRAPPRVRDRIVDAHPNCHLCGTSVQGTKWDLDHVVALINGGENREGNLRPVHRKCHLAKTASDVKEKAKVAKVRGKHNGSIRPKQTIKGPGFPATDRSDRPSKSVLPPLQRRQLYREAT